MGASSDWNVPAADFPAGAGAKDKLAFAVKYAMMAPGVSGWPAWDYRVMDGFAELLARDHSQASLREQEEREIMIGCGASLQLFKLSLKHLGCLGRVEMFPNLARPDLVATIHLGCATERDALEGRLFAAIRQGTTPASSALLDAEATLKALEHAGEGERSWVEFPRNETSRKRLQDLAPPRRFEVEEVQVRSKGWFHGAPRTGARLLFGRLSHWRKPQLLVKVRASAAPIVSFDNNSRATELGGAFAVLKTRTDDKHGWVAAGLTLARLLLQARILGISCAFHQETLRPAHMRAALRTEIGRKGFVQAILQFGLGSQRVPANEILQPFDRARLRTSLGSA